MDTLSEKGTAYQEWISSWNDELPEPDDVAEVLEALPNEPS